MSVIASSWNEMFSSVVKYPCRHDFTSSMPAVGTRSFFSTTVVCSNGSPMSKWVDNARTNCLNPLWQGNKATLWLDQVLCYYWLLVLDCPLLPKMEHKGGSSSLEEEWCIPVLHQSAFFTHATHHTHEITFNEITISQQYSAKKTVIDKNNDQQIHFSVVSSALTRTHTLIAGITTHCK